MQLKKTTEQVRWYNLEKKKIIEALKCTRLYKTEKIGTRNSNFPVKYKMQ